jgi:tRNA threonylcarbamoyladenosine biosynthesis protein TsaE
VTPMPLARLTVPPRGERLRVVSRSARGTHSLASRLAGTLPGGTVLALVGELGAGKTSFVQGLAEGLRVPELSQVLSPTYTLVNEYPGGRLTLVHVDWYRMTGSEQARGLGLDEQVGRPDALTAVEWADLLPDLVPDDAVWIVLKRLSPTAREIEIGIGRPARAG